MNTWQWVMGTSRNEKLIMNHDQKHLGFGSIFLCEVAGSGHIVQPFSCLKCYIVTDYSDLHYHVHLNFLL
jgi:hypothetical protein